jgi:WD40 repeat protein
MFFRVLIACASIYFISFNVDAADSKENDSEEIKESQQKFFILRAPPGGLPTLLQTMTIAEKTNVPDEVWIAGGFSPNGMMIFTSTMNTNPQSPTRKIWNAKTQASMFEISSEDSKYGFQFTPLSNNVITVNEQSVVKVLDSSKKGALIRDFNYGVLGEVKAVLSPDENVIVTELNDGFGAKVWNFANGKLLYRTPQNRINCSFSNDSTKIACALSERPEIVIMNAQDGKELLAIPVKQDHQVFGISFSADDKIVRAVSRNSADLGRTPWGASQYERFTVTAWGAENGLMVFELPQISDYGDVFSGNANTDNFITLINDDSPMTNEWKKTNMRTAVVRNGSTGQPIFELRLKVGRGSRSEGIPHFIGDGSKIFAWHASYDHKKEGWSKTEGFRTWVEYACTIQLFNAKNGEMIYVAQDNFEKGKIVSTSFSQDGNKAFIVRDTGVNELLLLPPIDDSLPWLAFKALLSNYLTLRPFQKPTRQDFLEQSKMAPNILQDTILSKKKFAPYVEALLPE